MDEQMLEAVVEPIPLLKEIVGEVLFQCCPTQSGYARKVIETLAKEGKAIFPGDVSTDFLKRYFEEFSFLKQHEPLAEDVNICRFEILWDEALLHENVRAKITEAHDFVAEEYEKATVQLSKMEQRLKELKQFLPTEGGGA